MNPRRVAVEMWPTLVFGGGLGVLVACIGSANGANAVRSVDRLAPALAANLAATAAPKAPAMTEPFMTGPSIDNAHVAVEAELLSQVAVNATVRNMPPVEIAQPVVVASLGDPSEVVAPQETPSMQTPVDAATADPADTVVDGTAIPGRIEIVGECLVAETCIDQFLWALYERAPKLDTVKESEQRKVSMRNKKGKMVKITKTFTRLVPNDFTWKDPKAAERMNMSMIDYVIGGMEKSFKLKLFRMLYAAENAGLSPGITSAFRDDYRQSIASGLKAASDRSYHGGSFRGGYGHGLAADIVSVKGATRAQRWVSTDALWKWVDTNGKDFGIGRPYLDRDPPHVGPMDGQEYVSRRGAPKAAAADAKQPAAQPTQDKPAAKRKDAAKPSKARTS